MRFGSSLRANKHLEEWNGLREITEYNFEYTGSSLTSLFTYLVAFPGLIYLVCKEEDEARRTWAGYEHGAPGRVFPNHADLDSLESTQIAKAAGGAADDEDEE